MGAGGVHTGRCADENLYASRLLEWQVREVRGAKPDRRAAAVTEALAELSPVIASGHLDTADATEALFSALAAAGLDDEVGWERAVRMVADWASRIGGAKPWDGLK